MQLTERIGIIPSKLLESLAPERWGFSTEYWIKVPATFTETSLALMEAEWTVKVVVLPTGANFRPSPLTVTSETLKVCDEDVNREWIASDSSCAADEENTFLVAVWTCYIRNC